MISQVPVDQVASAAGPWTTCPLQLCTQVSGRSLFLLVHGGLDWACVWVLSLRPCCPADPGRPSPIGRPVLLVGAHALDGLIHGALSMVLAAGWGVLAIGRSIHPLWMIGLFFMPDMSVMFELIWPGTVRDSRTGLYGPRLLGVVTGKAMNKDGNRYKIPAYP